MLAHGMISRYIMSALTLPAHTMAHTLAHILENCWNDGRGASCTPGTLLQALETPLVLTAGMVLTGFSSVNVPPTTMAGDPGLEEGEWLLLLLPLEVLLLLLLFVRGGDTRELVLLLLTVVGMV